MVLFVGLLQHHRLRPGIETVGVQGGFLSVRVTGKVIYVLLSSAGRLGGE